MTWLCWPILSRGSEHFCVAFDDKSHMWINPVFSAYGTSALHHFVDLALYVKLRVFGLHTFQLDGYFLSNDDVGA